MASPALAVLAALASRRSLFFFRARALLPDIALEEWMVCVRVVCVSLCVVVCLDVEASQKALFLGAAENEKSLTKKAPSARQLSGEGGW